jgi:peptide/nickel transport system substrate-binding protein
MRRRATLFNLVALWLLLATACAPGPSTTTSETSQAIVPPPAARPGAGRTLTVIAGSDLPTFAGKPILTSGRAVTTKATNARHILNASLTDLDPRGLPNPYLTEALPQLNTGSWQVFPDGKMETIYRLRPNLTWHDGQPLTADDFVFAWKVYSTPAFGVATSGVMGYIDEVSAPDPARVVFRWKRLYALADAIGAGTADNDLPPLPRHRLEQSFQQLDAEAFLGLPFWMDEYVGAGPWKLERNELGAFFEASAFDNFVFGRPKIDRVKVTYILDDNAVMANLLSGEAHYSLEGVLFAEGGLTLERAWGTSSGRVLWEQIAGRSLEIQQRPEFAVPRQLATDARVRQALAHAIDKDSLSEVVTGGHGLVREVYSHPNAEYYEAVLQAAPIRYTFDPRRAEQLLQEAGFRRGAEGTWVSGDGDRFTLEIWHLVGADNQRETTVVVDTLRRFGIDASGHLWGTQRTSAEERAKTSGIFAGQQNLPDRYHSREIARPENRWNGANRLGFSHPEMDRFTEVYEAALDRSERTQALAQMERVVNEQRPGIVLYYAPKVIGMSANLKGVPQVLTPEGQNGARKIWTWEWTA